MTPSPLNPLARALPTKPVVGVLLGRFRCLMLHRRHWVRRPLRVRRRAGFADFDCRRCGAGWIGQRIP